MERPAPSRRSSSAAPERRPGSGSPWPRRRGRPASPPPPSPSSTRSAGTATASAGSAAGRRRRRSAPGASSRARPQGNSLVPRSGPSRSPFLIARCSLPPCPGVSLPARIRRSPSSAISPLPRAFRADAARSLPVRASATAIFMGQVSCGLSSSVAFSPASNASHSRSAVRPPLGLGSSTCVTTRVMASISAAPRSARSRAGNSASIRRTVAATPMVWAVENTAMP